MAGRLRKLLDAGSRLFAAVSGGGKLPPAPIPKVKNKQQSFPSLLTTTQTNDNALPLQDRRLATLDIGTYRTGNSTRQVIRDLAASNPDLAAALNAYLRTAITDSYTAVAKNVDGTFNREATALVQQILTRFDVLGNYDDGFSGVNSMRSNSESLVKELLLTGAMSLELVLDKARLPRTLAPISTTQIQFKADDKWLKPVQVVGGEEIDLDIPTFFYCAIDQDLLQPYASSPFEPAIQPVLFSVDFMNDLRRIVKRAVHPRISVTIDEEKFRKTIPPEILPDPDKLTAYMNNVKSSIESQVNDLQPEDAVVMFDAIKLEYLSRGNESFGDEVKVLQDLANSKMTTGAKALPSILGHGTGSQNIASSETLLFMKNAAGVQAKLNEIYSKALTLAARLFGEDVYVEFKYASIDLRPESELEAFRVMRQSRVLEQLSYGFITDDDASIQLTGQLTPAGFKPLSGTQFLVPAPADAEGANPNSTTGPQNRRPSTPQQSKGPQKRADVIPLASAGE
jgi:hypothetical protein